MARKAKVRLHDGYRTNIAVGRWQPNPLIDQARELI